MSWARRAPSLVVGCALLCAPFVACSSLDSSVEFDDPAGGEPGTAATDAAAGDNPAGNASGGRGVAGSATHGGNATSGAPTGGADSKGGNGGSLPVAGRGGASMGGMPNGGMPNGGMPNGGSPNGGMPNGGMPNGGSGPNPSDIPTNGLVLWLKADAGVKVENGLVTAWADQSGSGHDATQAEVSAQPKLTKAGGLPLSVIELDGVNDHFELPTYKPVLSDGLTFFGVAGRSHESFCSGLLELSNGSEIDDISVASLNNSFQFEVLRDTVFAAADAFPQGELRLIEVQQSSDPGQPVATLLANGAEVGKGNVKAPLAINREQNMVGSSLYKDCTPFPGAIAEIILYGRALSQKERTSVESYLKQKWQCCN